MVQDAPGATGVAMPPALIATLAGLDGVTSVKVEAPPTAPNEGQVVTAVGEGFAVLGGQNARFVLEGYQRGAIGTMPACEFPDLLRPVLDAWADGRRAQARAEFTRITPLVLFGLQPGIAWAVHKEVLVRRGLIADAAVRSPPPSSMTRPARACTPCSTSWSCRASHSAQAKAPGVRRLRRRDQQDRDMGCGCRP